MSTSWEAYLVNLFGLQNAWPVYSLQQNGVLQRGEDREFKVSVNVKKVSRCSLCLSNYLIYVIAGRIINSASHVPMMAATGD